jgi:hypothetical protein
MPANMKDIGKMIRQMEVTVTSLDPTFSLDIHISKRKGIKIKI